METQITLALEQHGFTFENRDQLKMFCGSGRCEMQIKDQIKTLLVDDKAICQWDQAPEIKTNYTDKNYSITAEYNRFRIFEV